MMEKAILRLANSSRVENLVNSSPVTEEFLGNYVAGEDRLAAIEVVRQLIWQGLSTSLTVLAQDSVTVSEAERVRDEYLGLLAELKADDLGETCEVSLKGSTLGSLLSGDRLVENVASICSAAADSGLLVTLEMENADTVDATLKLADHLRGDFPWLGVTTQSMLYRSESDCRRLSEQGARVRLCKGVYRERASNAFTDRHQIDLNFVRLARILFEGDAYPMIATHDPRLINIAQQLAETNDYPAADWEIQMMMGVRTWEQRRIADIGQRCRVHVPYGTRWYPYYLRTIAERPDNVKVFARSLVGRR